MFQTVMSSIDGAVTSFVINLFTDLSNELTSTLRLMMIISFILYGLAMMKGWIQTSISDSIKHVFMTLIVYIFATNVGLFTSLTYDLFTNTPDMLAGKILIYSGSSDGGGANQFIDNAYDVGIRVAGDLLFGSGWSVGLKLVGFLVAIVTIAMCGYAGFLIILSKVAVAILLSLSPIFVAFLMFKSTRGLFEGWLRQVINYALIPLLTYTILIFCLAIIGPPVEGINKEQNDGALTFLIVLPYVFTCLISHLLLLQVMSITSGIAGGVSLSTLGVVENRFSRHGALSLSRLKGVDVKLPSFGKNTIKN